MKAQIEVHSQGRDHLRRRSQLKTLQPKQMIRIKRKSLR
jgi:hypothetical protein